MCSSGNFQPYAYVVKQPHFFVFIHHMADTVLQLVIVKRMMSDLGPLEFHDKLKEAHLRVHSYFLFLLNSLV